MLDAVADAFGLDQLADVKQGTEVFRVLEHLPDIVQNFIVGGVVFLMLFHDVGKNIQVFFAGESFDGFQTRERLNAKFAHKARKIVAIVLNRLVVVPHAPIMHIAEMIAVGIDEAAAR